MSTSALLFFSVRLLYKLNFDFDTVERFKDIGLCAVSIQYAP